MSCSIRLIFSISDIDAEADGMNELASEEESSESTAEVPADELGPVAVETQIVVSKESGGALTIDAVAEGEFPSKKFEVGESRADLRRTGGDEQRVHS